MIQIWDGSKKPIRSSIQETVEWIDDIPIESVVFESKEYESKEEEQIFKDTLNRMPKMPVTIADFDDFYERLIVNAIFHGFDLNTEDL